MASSLLSSTARRLEGKVALITGGTNEIGEWAARLFCLHGAKVVIADVDDDKGHSLVADIGQSEAVSYVHCDVTSEADVRNAVDTAVSRHGKLDIMFNNATTVDAKTGPISESDRADFDRVMATNVTGVYLGIKHAARVMVPARHGSIISTASVSSLVGGIAPNAYSCSKHAVVGLTTSAAVELGQVGVRVNCVSPHAMATAQASKAFGMPVEQVAVFIESRGVLRGVKLQPQDVAEAALYLGSDESRYVSGHNLVVDGGFTKVNGSIPPYMYPTT